jgi:PilZ domain
VKQDKELHDIERIVPRYQFEVRFKIEMHGAVEKQVTEGWARDLSETGLGAFVARELPLGELATLQIPLPDGVELSIPARVTRNIGTQYGFQFTAMTAAQRTEILRVLTQSKELPYVSTGV